MVDVKTMRKYSFAVQQMGVNLDPMINGVCNDGRAFVDDTLMHTHTHRHTPKLVSLL